MGGLLTPCHRRCVHLTKATQHSIRSLGVWRKRMIGVWVQVGMRCNLISMPCHQTMSFQLRHMSLTHVVYKLLTAARECSCSAIHLLTMAERCALRALCSLRPCVLQCMVLSLPR
jgi:hypothetical protein